MCNVSCLHFSEKYLTEEEIKGKRVIEIGSNNVNGSVRAFIESMGPSEYIGVDIEKGCGVDVVCTAEGVRDRFGDESFNVVVSTEMLEHVRDWRKAISNMKNICKPNGIILITTRSFGFPYHGWPYDFWRFEYSDMAQIFSDCMIQRLERDSSAPGIFIKAIKSAHFAENNLSQMELYSMVSGKRSREIDDADLKDFIERNSENYKHPERQTLKEKMQKLTKNICRIINKLSGHPLC